MNIRWLIFGAMGVAFVVIMLLSEGCDLHKDPSPPADGGVVVDGGLDGGLDGGAPIPQDGSAYAACLELRRLRAADCRDNCETDYDVSAPRDKPNAIYCLRGDRSACHPDCKPACDDRVHVPEVQPCPTCRNTYWDFAFCGPKDGKYYEPYCQDLGPDPEVECQR